MFSPDMRIREKAQRQFFRLDYPPAPYALFFRNSFKQQKPQAIQSSESLEAIN